MFVGIYRGKQAHADDLETVVQRAQKVGTTLQESRAALTLATTYNMYATVGCHPTHAGDIESHPQGPKDYFDSLFALIHSDTQTNLQPNPRVVAIGECGLDYDRTHFCPIHIQKRHFESHFALASRSGLPMLFHDRNTGPDFINMVRKHRKEFTTGVVHSYTGSIDDMTVLTSELGLYIGINGCSMKTNENIQVVKLIPLDRLMLETDAPWCDIRPTHASFSYMGAGEKSDPLLDILGPEAKKKEKFVMGQRVKGRNEPCSMRHVLRAVAAIREMSEDVLAHTVYMNTLRVFFPSEHAEKINCDE
ncbi:hypothetical protein BASA81_018329 [Batrachochytrium salamandrivorans]|nr:hypothetical protein BASA81_018329 [Batrachochytrium salamandrivorans]